MREPGARKKSGGLSDKLGAAILAGALVLPMVAFCPGCASTPKGKTLRTTEAGRSLLFPYGIYRHEVHVTLARRPASGPRDFSFRGLAQIRSEVIRIAVLSPFNTTLLKLTEDRRTGAISTESYSGAFRKLEPRIREYYSTLRLLLTLSLPVSVPGLTVTSRTGDGLPVEIRSDPDGTVYRFAEYDGHGLPGRIQIVNSRFTVTIEVSAYEI